MRSGGGPRAGHCGNNETRESTDGLTSHLLKAAELREPTMESSLHREPSKGLERGSTRGDRATKRRLDYKMSWAWEFLL